MTITTAEARKAGYEINRGSYVGTTDDNIDRWYIEAITADAVDRRGQGYATRRESLESLDRWLWQHPENDKRLSYAVYVGTMGAPVAYGATVEEAATEAVAEIKSIGGIGPEPHQWPTEQALIDALDICEL